MKTYLQISSIIFLLLFFIACNENSKPNQPPILVIAANPTSGVAPLAVSFTSSAEDPDGVIASYSWNFGDGTGSSAQQNPSYTYAAAGTFTATCTVSDNGKPALTASATVVITVYQSKIPTLSSISPDWSVIHMPEFTLTATGTDFLPDSKIVFDDKVMKTVYISPTELTCEIMPDDTVLASALKSDGSLDLEADQYTDVLVRNPGTYGGDSAALSFTVRPNHIFESPHLVSPTSDRWSWYAITLHRGKNLYVVYSNPSSSYDDRIRVSKDLGRTWGEAHEIPYLGGYWKFPITAGYDGILYLFKDEHLYKSSDDGKTWSDPILVSDGTPDEGCIAYWTDSPNILRFSDGTLYAAWGESKNDVCYDDMDLANWIWHCTSKDGGLTWSEIKKIPNPNGSDYYAPTLFKTLSGRIHYFFGSGIDPQYPTGYHHMTSSDGGVSWSTPAEISSFTGLTYNSPVVGGDDGLYIPDNTVGASSQEISIKYWLDGAPSWGRTPAAVSLDLSQTVKTMSVCVDSAGNINLFYTRGPDQSSFVLYYQRSIDLGRTWTAPMRLSPIGCRAGLNAQVCGAVGNLFVIWASVNSPYPLYFTSSERNR